MRILILVGKGGIEILNYLGALIFEASVCFVCYLEQVLSIAKIQAKAKNDHIKRIGIKRQIIGRADLKRDAWISAFAIINGLDRRINAIAVCLQDKPHNFKPMPSAASNFKNPFGKKFDRFNKIDNFIVFLETCDHLRYL